MSGAFVMFLLFSTYFVCYTDCYEEGEVRLVNGPSNFLGRVEIFHNGEWGTVCDDLWDDVDATVVCRQLGLNKTGISYSNADFGMGSGAIWLDDIQCIGNEGTLSTCSNGGFGNHNCGHTEDAGVGCTDIRLVQDSSQPFYPKIGRVEVRKEDEWVAVLADNWNDADADVVCRQLGVMNGVPRAFTTNRSLEQDDLFQSDSHRDQDNVASWACGVDCDGSENSLTECSSLGNWGTDECVHNQIAIVGCERIVRLVSEDGRQNEGRVEVFFSSEWGSVCDDHWDDVDATVVCRETGRGNYGRAVHGSLYGKGSGAMWLDDVNCSGDERSLLECDHAGLGRENCLITEEAGVICSDDPPVPPPLDVSDYITTPRDTFLERRHVLLSATVGITFVMCIGLLCAVAYLVYVVRWKMQVNSPTQGTIAFSNLNSYGRWNERARLDLAAEDVYMNDRQASSHNQACTGGDLYDY